MVQQRREPCFLVLSCYLAHTVQRTWHAWPGTVSGTCFAGRVPLGQPPFLHRLRDRSPGLVRRLRRYYGAVRLPMLVHLRRTASAFPERPARLISRTGEHGISRFSRMEIPYMHRFSDRAGSAGGSR